MNEFNFFAIDRNKKSKKSGAQLDLASKIPVVMIPIPIILFILFITLIVLNYKYTNQIYKVESLSKSLQTQITIKNLANGNGDTTTNNDVNAFLQKELYKFKYALAKKEELDKSNVINAQAMDTIRKAVPKGLFLNSVSVDGSTAQISGYAITNQLIAQFQYTLSQSPYFDNVFVPTITKDLGNYNFELNAKVKTEVNTEVKAEVRGR